jgi:hypothetical protein
MSAPDTEDTPLAFDRTQLIYASHFVPSDFAKDNQWRSRETGKHAFGDHPYATLNARLRRIVAWRT